MNKKCCVIGLLLLFLLPLYSLGQELRIPRHKTIDISSYLQKIQAASSKTNNNRHTSGNNTTSCGNDSVVLTRQSQVDSFPITNPDCTVLRYLTIDGFNASPAITQLDSLRYITQVTEEFTITDTYITSLSALTSLTVIGGNVRFQTNNLMTSLGLSPAINMDQVETLSLINLPELANITELRNKVKDSQLWDILIFYTGLTDLAGLDSIHHSSFLNISGNSRLQSLHGLEGLTSVDFFFTINYNDSLTSLAGLNNLDSMVYTGNFECSYNLMLTNFSGLSNLTYMEGALWIQGNDNLTTLSDLNPSLFVHDYDGDSVLITDNQQLAVCGSPPICDFINRASTIRIENNAPGCNNIAEVQAACTTTPPCSGELKTWNGSITNNWDDEDNWTPVGVPGICDSVLIPGIANFPQLNSETTISGLRMLQGAGLFQGSYNLIVNGNVIVDSASIGNGLQAVLSINSSQNVIRFNHANVYPFVEIQNYSGGLTFLGNYFSKNVTVSDSSTRTGANHFSGNYFNHNFSITANATNINAATYFDEITGDVVLGDATFTVTQPVPFSIGNNTLYLGGNFTVNSNFLNYPDVSYGAIYFQTGDSVNAHIRNIGTNNYLAIGFLVADKPGGTITLDQDVYITHNGHFNWGPVKTDSTKLLIFTNGAGIDQYSSASYIDGPLKKIGNQPFSFPVGDNSTSSVCSISAPALYTDAYTARYFHNNPSSAGYDTSQHASSLLKILSKEYWTINRNNGNAKVKLSFTYDTARSGPISSMYDLRIAGWNGSQWQNLGNGGVTGNQVSGTISTSDSVSAFGAFALALVPHRIPVITIANADSVICASFATPSFVHFTVDTLMLGNNAFKLQISDSSGSFVNLTQIGQLISNHSDSIFASIPTNFPYSNHYKIRVVGDAPPDTSVAKTITVLPFPNAGMVVHGPTVGCVAGAVYKYWLTPVQQGITYNWSLNTPLGTITSNYDTAYVTWTTPGNLAVQVQNSNKCINGSFAYIGVTVSPVAPTQTPVLTNTGRWLFSTTPAANQNSLGYHWYRNDTLINGANNSTYYAAAAGTYKVKYYNLCNEGPASNTISFAAASLPQTISFPPITNKTYGDPDFVIPAPASSGLPVSFSITSGPGTIPGNIYHITTTGTATIKATQPGDNVYDTAASVSQTFTINKATQTISFPAIPDKNYGVAPFALSASSSSGLAISYSILSGPATVNGNTVTVTGAGTVTVRARQQGDTNYLAASPVDRSFCVLIASLNPISGPISICPANNATYTVNNIPGATYTWRIAGGSTLSSITNTVTTTWPSPGTYTLIANAVGNCGVPSTNDSITITAITSVQPDSVNNMLPANGAINQQLPLTLSWIPAYPNFFYTYDLYLWRSDLPQPSTAYASNITTVNYTIPLNSGLSYGYTYKWMIAAHNGSCVVTTGGPIQTFGLIPLPDLEVYNVNAPATVLSGQPVSVTWKVKNNGPGNTQTGQYWTDAVFIWTDSLFRNYDPLLPFPFTPVLVATKPNVTALNAGQFYNDTVTFNTPVTYSGPLYMHVITNYAPPANNPLIEITKLNDTAHAMPATVVTLSPQPDLRVDTVVNPGNTFSGSTINITYKVKNYNVSTNGNASWVDKIYISKDAVFNINTATLLKLPNTYGNYYPANDVVIGHSNGLQQDSSYMVSVPVVIPNFIFGGYYVYVFTNANNDLYEGPNNNNNINHGNLLQVYLTATPKLIPVNLTVASGISTTQPVPVSWYDQNQGAYDNLQANWGHYFVFDQLPPPCAVSGLYRTRDSLGFGSSSWIDRVYLSTDSSGLNIPASTLIGGSPHNDIGNYLHLGPYPPTQCGVNISGGENIFAAILPNSNHLGSFYYIVPADLPPGDYYMYVYANPTKTVYEYPGTAQIIRSNKITVSWPDLTIPSVTVPTTGNSGQPFTVNYSMLNAGPGAVYNHFRKDYIYMGNSSTFNGSAVLLDSVIYSSASVPVNISQSLQKVITLPNGVSGSKFIFVRANGDSSFKETNFNNNINTTGAPVTITLTPPPDLQVTSIAMTDTVSSVFGFPFKYTVTNTGSGLASGTWKDSIFYSCNSSFGYTNTYFAAIRTHQEYLPANASYTDSFTLVIPMTFLTNNSNCLAGDTSHIYLFVKTNANNGLYEPVTNNNTGGTTQKTIANPIVDHIVTNVTSADSTSTGQYFKIKWTVKNLGYNPNNYTYGDPVWYDNVFVSTDSVLNINAVQISYKTGLVRLNHNQSYSDSLFALIPNLPSGYYYLFANANCYDRIYAERNLGNNANLRRNGAGQPVKIYINNTPAADLTDSIITVPSSAAVGQPVKIVYQVKNTGQGLTNAGYWIDDYWLSNNFQPAGLYLGSRNHYGALLPGQSYIDSFTAVIPITQPIGNYTLVVRTARDYNIYETNYNNNLAFRFLSVYSPAPTDLVVNTIAATDTLILGKTTSVNWNIGNISNNPASGYETDGIYLGSDSLTDSNNDILIGTKQNQLNILPLASVTQNSQPVVSGVTEGNYFLKVKTDIQNNILETNKLNNTGVRAGRVYVKVNELPLNISVPDSLRASYFYYKLVVPAALIGKTIQVKLTSNDSLTANNQMYIGLGYLPSAAHFDYTYNNANYGNQQIVIESVIDSVYYIVAKGTKPNAAYQLVSLKATELPFAITSVNANRGGNTGNVTVLVKGSLFTNNMIARLRGVALNNNINASAIYFINSTTLYATFNLAGKPLGLYDVILKKPDSSGATLSSGFTIELTNNGGLITGTGPNTGQIGSGNAPGCDPGASSGLNSQLQTELLIPPHVFNSWPFVIQINYVNTTNVDIAAQVKILYSLNNAPLSFTEAGLSDGKTSLYIEFKDSVGPPNMIRAGGSGTIRVYSKPPPGAGAHSFLNYTFQ